MDIRYVKIFKLGLRHYLQSHVYLLFCFALFAYKVEDDSNILNQDTQYGRELYIEHCAGCHGINGRGVPKAIPPLAKSDYLFNNRDSSIYIIKYGWKGPIIVNGIRYKGVMPASSLNNEEIADVLNYIGKVWGNRDTTIYTGTYIESLLKKNIIKK